MVQVWYFNDDGTDQRSSHQHDPVQLINLHKLKEKTGVLYWKIDADNYDKEGKLDVIRKERGYTYTDCIECCPEKLENYEDKLKSFFLEHIHADEEIRFVLEGSGYFDCRDMDDKWIRIQVTKGDLITLPAGIYHRFTLDEKNYIKAMRLFVGEPVWTPINRPADDHPARKQYIQSANDNFQQTISQSA